VKRWKLFFTFRPDDGLDSIQIPLVIIIIISIIILWGTKWQLYPVNSPTSNVCSCLHCCHTWRGQYDEDQTRSHKSRKQNLWMITRFHRISNQNMSAKITKKRIPYNLQQKAVNRNEKEFYVIFNRRLSTVLTRKRISCNLQQENIRRTDKTLYTCNLQKEALYIDYKR